MNKKIVATSTFASKFILLHIAIELIEGFCYEIHGSGIPIINPTTVFCNNIAARSNVAIPESRFEKKPNS